MILARLLLAVLLSVGVAWCVDFGTARRGLMPPGLLVTWRRTAAVALLASLFLVTLFGPMLAGGEAPSLEPGDLSLPRLFAVHFLLAVTVIVWLILGFAGFAGFAGFGRRQGGGIEEGSVASQSSTAGAIDWAREGAATLGSIPAPVAETASEPGRSLDRRPGKGAGRGRFGVWASQLGLVAKNPAREIGLGLVAGVVCWAIAVGSALLLAGALVLVGGEELVPKAPPELVPLLAALPVALRCAIALSAGVFEEIFFRGLLQPRVGVLLSTACFVLAHVGYGQPFMLVQILVLSLLFAFLVVWRQSILAAITAHVVFDAVQLVFVIPAALHLLDGSETAG